MSRAPNNAAAPIPPVGPQPNSAVLLLGGLLYSSPAEASAVLEHVLDRDMPTPSTAIVLAAVRRLIARGTPPAATLVADELRREGTLRQFAARELQDATTCGAQALAVREYAAAVVAESFRRLVESAGVALQAAATECAEDELAPMVARATESASDCARRLRQLRSGEL